MMMNQWKYLFGLLFLFLLACSRAGEHEALFRQVESVVNDHPDSAMVLLQRIEESERLDSADWARWALLTTQARDKAFINHTTDSVINRVADYYQRFGDNHQKALAYYYVGRVNSDLGQLKRATDAYLRASDYSAKTDDHNLSFLILTQMGARFAYQGLTHEAERAYRKAFEIATQANDSVNMAFGFAYLARVCGLRKDWAQAENYYLESIAIAEKIGHSHAFKLGVQELASVYSRRNRLDKALVWARRLVEFEGLDGLPDRLSAHLVIGNIYREMGQVDSAYFYISHAIGSYNIYTRRSAYQALYFMYRDMGRHEEAIKYNDLFQSCQDSIKKMGSASDLYQVKEAHETVKRQVVDMRRWLSAGAVVLALLVALGYFYYRYRTGRKRMERQILYLRQEEERLKDELKGINQDQDFKRKRNQEIVDRLTHDLAAVQKQLEQETAKWRTKYAKAQELAKSYKKELRQYADGPLAERRPFEEVLDQLRKEPRVLSEQERQELRLFMDAQNNSFTVRLLEANPELKAGDLLLCCLIRLGFSGKSLATLLAINLNSVTKQKQRLRGRLVQKPANDAELTDYIRNF